MAQSNVADILLIGSGGAGGPFAWYLSQVEGITIVCLEQGDWEGNQRSQESLSSVRGWGADDPQWKRLIEAPRQPGAVYFPNGYPYDRTESYWEPILGFHVGGASVHWAGGWGRFRPSDFLQRTLTGYGADWPFPYEELARWYDYNDALVGISGEPHTLPNGEPAYPYRRAIICCRRRARLVPGRQRPCLRARRTSSGGATCAAASVPSLACRSKDGIRGTSVRRSCEPTWSTGPTRSRTAWC